MHLREKILISIIFLTSLLLIIAVYLLRADYLKLRAGGMVFSTPYHLRLGRGFGTPSPAYPVPVTQAGMIRYWMTFEYINGVFGLPPTYLQSKLSLTEARYPKVTIRETADDEHVPVATLLAKVQSAVQDFRPPTSP